MIALASTATNFIAVHRAGGVVGVRDIAQSKWLLNFKPFHEKTTGLALSPDGKLLVMGSEQALGIWRISSRSKGSAEALWIHKQDAPCGLLRFSPDGESLVARSRLYRDGLLSAWDIQTGQELAPFPEASAGNILTMSLSPDGSMLAYSGVSTRITVFDFASRTLKFSLKGHLGMVTSLAFSADGTQLISGGVDGTIRTWCTRSGHSLGLWRDAHESGVWQTGFAPDGKGIFSMNGAEFKIWSSAPQTTATLIDNQQEVGGPWPAISPDGKWLVTTSAGEGKALSESDRAKIWDLTSGQQRLYLAHKDPQVVGSAFSPDGKLFALGSQGRLIGLWRTSTWEQSPFRASPFTYLTNDFEAGSIAFSVDNRFLAVAGTCWRPFNPSHATNRLAFWEVEHQRKLDLLPGAGAGSNEWAAAATVAFSGDGRWIALGSRDGFVQLWDFPAQHLIRKFGIRQPKSRRYDVLGVLVIFSPDHRWLAACAHGEREVALLDLSNLHLSPRFLPTDKHDRCWSFVFDPESTRLATGGGDGLVRLWDVNTFDVTLSLRHEPTHSLYVTFAPRGNLLVSQDAEGRLRFWPAIPRAQIPHSQSQAAIASPRP